MTRDTFKMMAANTLRQNAGRPLDQLVEALAVGMDRVRELEALLGQTDAPAEVIPTARTPFPAPNPEALMPAAPLSDAAPSGQDTAYAGPPLIIPATSIPDKVERVVDPAPRMIAADPEPPRRRLKVEELSALVQRETPPRLFLDVPLGEGDSRVARVTFERNVVSMHAFDSVKLIYFPPNVLQTARESAEVEATIHAEDGPWDFAAVVKKLQEQAIESIKPRRPIQSVMPAATSGPVQHAGDTYQDPLLSAQTRNAFNSLG